jgi:Putative auto-transporter adhesin, head GIN domain
MKNKNIKIIFIIINGILFGCQNSININEPNNHITGSGKIVNENRIVDDCNGIVLSNLGEVYLTQSDKQSIFIEADNNIIDYVITRKENGSLLVGLPSGSYSNITLRIYVSLKDINIVSINGAGIVECAQPVSSDNLYCSINGAGKLTLKGEGNFLNCTVNGAGYINAKDFIVEKGNAVINGAGTCLIYATNELDAYVSGAGSIIYYGNPEIVKSSVSGVGQIKVGL